MREHLFFPTTPKITVSANDEMIQINQYWEQLGAGIENANVHLPRQLFIPFIEALFARMNTEEIAQARVVCDKWQEIIAYEEQEALNASREDKP